MLTQRSDKTPLKSQWHQQTTTCPQRFPQSLSHCTSSSPGFCKAWRSHLDYSSPWISTYWCLTPPKTSSPCITSTSTASTSLSSSSRWPWSPRLCGYCMRSTQCRWHSSFSYSLSYTTRPAAWTSSEAPLSIPSSWTGVRHRAPLPSSWWSLFSLPDHFCICFGTRCIEFVMQFLNAAGVVAHSRSYTVYAISCDCYSIDNLIGQNVITWGTLHF